MGWLVGMETAGEKVPEQTLTEIRIRLQRCPTIIVPLVLCVYTTTTPYVSRPDPLPYLIATAV